MKSRAGTFMGLLFILISIIPALIIPVSTKIKENRCTLAVDAVIVDVRVDADDDDVTYAPVYQFELDGGIITGTANLYTSKYPEIGKEVQLFVNPDNTEEFYNKKTDIEIILLSCTVGFTFLVFGIFCFLNSSGILQTMNRRRRERELVMLDETKHN